MKGENGHRVRKNVGGFRTYILLAPDLAWSARGWDAHEPPNDQANIEAIYTVGPILIAVLAPGLAWSARGWDAHEPMG
jgi:hypothetical protein